MIVDLETKMASKISSTVVGKRFRESFKHVGKDVLHYFPSHMAKGLQQMQKTLKQVDCIIEVHDARIPFSGRNPRFGDTLMVRPHILILNKMDLASMQYHRRIESTLKAEGVKKVLYTCCKENMNVTIKSRILPAVVKLVESGDRFNRSEAEDYSVLVIGVPNVGKSSLINALRQVHLKKGGKATPVGARPGITRSVMEKIRHKLNLPRAQGCEGDIQGVKDIGSATVPNKTQADCQLLNNSYVFSPNGHFLEGQTNEEYNLVSDQPKIYVYDSPGIMLPHIPNMDVGMKLALCGTLQDHLIGTMTIADYLLFILNKLSYFKYVKHFGLDEPTDEIYGLLSHIAKQNNLILKTRSTAGGYVYRTNFVRAGEIFIRDFRAGLLGKVNLDADQLPSMSDSSKDTDDAVTFSGQSE